MLTNEMRLKMLTHNVNGFVSGMADAIRLPESQPVKERKIQTKTNDQQRSVEPRTEAKQRTEAADTKSQPCWHKASCYGHTLLCQP